MVYTAILAQILFGSGESLVRPPPSFGRRGLYHPDQPPRRVFFPRGMGHPDSTGYAGTSTRKSTTARSTTPSTTPWTTPGTAPTTIPPTTMNYSGDYPGNYSADDHLIMPPIIPATIPTDYSGDYPGNYSAGDLWIIPPSPATTPADYSGDYPGNYSATIPLTPWQTTPAITITWQLLRSHFSSLLVHGPRGNRYSVAITTPWMAPDIFRRLLWQSLCWRLLDNAANFR